MPPSRELRFLLRWFQDGVVGPHEGRRRTRRAPAASILLPSRTLSPQERLGLYSGGYLARLVEALEQDYPAVCRLLGHRRFHRLCRAYLERFPSRSRLLNSLGRRLPEFLSSRVEIPRREAVRDLSRVEAAMSEVFDGEPAAALAPADFAKLLPERWAATRLRFVPTFRLLELAFSVNGYIDAVRQERAELPPIRRRRSWMAIYRKEFQVCRLDLDEAAYGGLAALRDGRSLARSVSEVARRWRGPSRDLEPKVRLWFGQWATEGFFRERVDGRR